MKRRFHRMLWALVAVWVGQFAGGNGFAEELPGTDSVLIQHVMLAEQGSESEPQTVNLLVEQGRLKTVTLDAVPEKEQPDLVVGARGGYVLGRLEVGDPAGFMILDHNPLEHFEVLLDTRKHAVFVIRNGQIIRNRLARTSKEAEVSEKKSGWFAYSVPPIVLPISYQNTRKWNRFQSKYIDGLFVGAVMLDRMGWLHQNDAGTGQVGNLSPYDGGEIRALRFGVVGTLNFERPWICGGL